VSLCGILQIRRDTKFHRGSQRLERLTEKNPL
jgi:hypothetical protein